MNWTKLTTVATGIVAVAGAAAVFGLKEVPRPAWSSEMQSIAGNLIELDSRVTAQQLEAAKLRYYQNLREQAEFNGHLVPDYLIEEQVQLEQLIDELEIRLEKLRNQS